MPKLKMGWNYGFESVIRLPNDHFRDLSRTDGIKPVIPIRGVTIRHDGNRQLDKIFFQVDYLQVQSVVAASLSWCPEEAICEIFKWVVFRDFLLKSESVALEERIDLSKDSIPIYSFVCDFVREWRVCPIHWQIEFSYDESARCSKFACGCELYWTGVSTQAERYEERIMLGQKKSEEKGEDPYIEMMRIAGWVT